MSLGIGIGYDSHRFDDGGGRLLLGGVEIDYERGLSGHSDADVLTHTIIDALLGAAGRGDIGGLFPDTDDAWKDADSLEMLKVVVGNLAGKVVNVDATVICEEPRLGPYRAQIEKKLSDVLLAPVNVKATSNEGMGAIGRGEGIACMAVALIEA